MLFNPSGGGLLQSVQPCLVVIPLCQEDTYRPVRARHSNPHAPRGARNVRTENALFPASLRRLQRAQQQTKATTTTKSQGRATKHHRGIRTYTSVYPFFYCNHDSRHGRSPLLSMTGRRLSPNSQQPPTVTATRHSGRLVGKASARAHPTKHVLLTKAILCSNPHKDATARTNSALATKIAVRHPPAQGPGRPILTAPPLPAPPYTPTTRPVAAFTNSQPHIPRSPPPLATLTSQERTSFTWDDST